MKKCCLVRKQFILLVFISFILVFFGGLSAQAAQLKLTTKNQPGQAADWLYVDLLLDPQGESINAIAGKVKFDPRFLSVHTVSDGNSIVNLWTQKPHMTNGLIDFSGIIPGGWSKGDGLVLSLIFKAKQTGNTNLAITDGQALLNDGQGTAAALKIQDLTLTAATSSNNFEPLINDQEPPENFTPEISANPNIFNNQYFLVFATQDKISGLDYYEVAESSSVKSADELTPNDWQKVESPYLLKDQSLNSYIYVRAVDLGGNARLVSVSPPKPHWQKKLLTDKQIPVILIIVMVMIVGMVILIIKSRARNYVRKQGGKIKK